MAKAGGLLTNNITREASRQPVQVPGSFVTQDATGTPQTSPLTVSSTIINLVVPDNAIQLVISNNANALRISELAAMTRYYLIPASSSNLTFDCAKMQNIYLVRDAADVTVQFMFQVL